MSEQPIIPAHPGVFASINGAWLPVIGWERVDDEEVGIEFWPVVVGRRMGPYLVDPDTVRRYQGPTWTSDNPGLDPEAS
jgi:hypothetical protein